MPVTLTWRRSTREINVTGRSAQRGFFSQHMPGFDGHAQFQLHVLHLNRAVVRKAEFKEWRKPLQLKWIASRVAVRRPPRANLARDSAAA